MNEAKRRNSTQAKSAAVIHVTDDASADMGAGGAPMEAIAQMRAIAARSGDSLLLADGPPHPDYELLDVCGEALEYIVAARRHRRLSLREGGVHDDAAWELRRQCEGRAKGLMGRAKKLRATTPAGIYAKALLVRASVTGAAVLAHSLADELVDCPELRAGLWPAQVSGSPPEA